MHRAAFGGQLVNAGATASKGPKAGTVEMKLEVAVIPVLDIDRAKRFYENLGWRLYADFLA
jgi:Bleomycin resistance protein-like N-terminal